MSKRVVAVSKKMVQETGNAERYYWMIPKSAATNFSRYLIEKAFHDEGASTANWLPKGFKEKLLTFNPEPNKLDIDELSMWDLDVMPEARRETFQITWMGSHSDFGPKDAFVQEQIGYVIFYFEAKNGHLFKIEVEAVPE